MNEFNEAIARLRKAVEDAEAAQAKLEAHQSLINITLGLWPGWIPQFTAYLGQPDSQMLTNATNAETYAQEHPL